MKDDYRAFTHSLFYFSTEDSHFKECEGRSSMSKWEIMSVGDSQNFPHYDIMRTNVPY